MLICSSVSLLIMMNHLKEILESNKYKKNQFQRRCIKKSHQ